MNSETSHHPLPDASRLLDTLLERYQLKNDAELCRRMNVLPSRISKMRSGRHPITAELLLRVHETFELSFAELRVLLRARPAFMHTSPGRPATPGK